MRVLVTGHRGYVGSVTAPFLAAAGHDVSGLDTGYYEGCDFGLESPVGLSRRLDVRDVGQADLEGVDAVVHLAALSNDPIGDLNPDWTRRINLDGTVTLARLAREAGVRRFVFASSCSIYGASGTDDALDEDAPFRPLTAYAESKVRAEEALADLADGSFAPIFMRNATVCGVSPRLRLDVVLNNLAAWAHTTGAVRLLSDGSAWRPLIHVRDVALVTRAVLEAPEHLVRRQAFNVGSDRQNYRVVELARLLSAESGCHVELADDAQPDQRSYRVDFTKLRRTLPEVELQWDAARGARELLGAYRAHGLTREEFEGRSYIRLRQLRHLLDQGALDADLRWADAAGEASVAVHRD
jgi:nucleoside-diphosphate-sugar epimerase